MGSEMCIRDRGSSGVFKDNELENLDKPLDGLVGESVTVEFKEK